MSSIQEIKHAESILEGEINKIPTKKQQQGEKKKSDNYACPVKLIMQGMYKGCCQDCRQPQTQSKITNQTLFENQPSAIRPP